ncbi:hypothetical protein CLAFUW4_07860 [Fulvia fulva]|uniref:DUF6697 domain-containing protein n=1 Tax=Passalora fulva TaxID=5499 RepID=A0A9Q8LC43_PASFU|nr:uncharacterized protein CLAFUR5_07984 [Fulvia fulva]KAK4629523.1 hypothetical protein CLAFUR4_07865 [Fulvia fulva]KAK4630171.1 hypothetical protein CLAFUR0_07862 [Fulvia fulva]UJO14659.1 hypothetical protein CLAFUR5_07984 [Fulvia fulva]WPV12673.1 hypothetical protein CLAFUW4_07860 [Fulvia fulva]WPV27242.1 hypothetical protein CLAFUW7_07861 [Fulvia fulva]
MASHQFSSEHPAYNYHNMAYPSGYIQPQWSTGYNANIHMPTPSYDPSTPSFQPNGMDMQRYHEPRTASMPDMQKMRKYLVDMNVSHMSDNVRLEKMARGTAKEVAELRSMLQRDLRILEGRIKSLQEDDAETDDTVINRGTSAVPAMNRMLKADDEELLSMDLSPRKEMTDNFATEQIAEEYLTRADIMATVAFKLRREADKLKGIIIGAEDAPADKLLEAPPTPGSKVIGFACCETAYGDINELLAHVKEAHPDAVKPRLGSDTGSHSTPTHAPAPRPHSSKSRALEVKAPAADKATSGAKETLARLYEKCKAPEAREEAAAAAKAQPLPQPQATDRTEVAAEAPIAALPQASDHSQIQVQSQVPIQSQHGTKWVPFAVTQMKERTATIPSNTVTFSKEFLRQEFGGEEWSSGFYFNSKAGNNEEGSAYWILDSEHEPYLPEAPGKNGAKLTPFFNDTITLPGEAPYEWHYEKCPVFIKEKDSAEYKYYGSYSQTRFSDKVDYDHLMTEIPEHVRHYWADQLSNPGRPRWVTEKLMDQFWQRPKYEGPTPTDSALQTPATFATGEDSAGGIERRVTKALAAYAERLKDWGKDALVKVTFLTKDAIFESFTKSDLEIEPGMRLWWEYLEFKKFDSKLLDTLVKLSKNPSVAKASGKTGSKRPVTPPIRDSTDTEMKAGALDEKEERKLKQFMPPRPATPPVRGTHETSMKAGTIDKNAVQVVKPSPPKDGSDVAAAVAKLQKEATQKQAAIDSKARKAALDQKQRDAARAPTQAGYPSFNESPKTSSRASAIPKEGLNGLGTYLLDEDEKKPTPTWGGGGDLDIAKRLNDEMRKAAPVPGKGNAPKHVREKAVAPHLRKK